MVVLVACTGVGSVNCVGGGVDCVATDGIGVIDTCTKVGSAWGGGTRGGGGIFSGGTSTSPSRHPPQHLSNTPLNLWGEPSPTCLPMHTRLMAFATITRIIIAVTTMMTPIMASPGSV